MLTLHIQHRNTYTKEDRYRNMNIIELKRLLFHPIGQDSPNICSLGIAHENTHNLSYFSFLAYVRLNHVSKPLKSMSTNFKLHFRILNKPQTQVFPTEDKGVS